MKKKNQKYDLKYIIHLFKKTLAIIFSQHLFIADSVGSDYLI